MPRLTIAALALLVASSLGVQAQPAPAIDYGRLLDARFLVNQGTFMFGTPKRDFMLFPPPIQDSYSVNGAYIVRDSDGRVVQEQRIGVVNPTGSDAVVTLQTSGPPPQTSLAAGDYTLSVEFEGHTLTSIPFRASVEDGGDPFDPKTIWTLDGPWRTHAYFSHETERPDYLMYFNAWVGSDDMPSNKPSEVSIRRNGEEVAFGHGFVDLTYGWGRVEYRLFKPEGRHDQFGRHATNAPSWTIQDVTAGTYEIELSSEDGAFRTFTIEAADGEFVHHANSDIQADRSVFLTPRRFEGQNLNRAHSLFWVVNE